MLRLRHLLASCLVLLPVAAFAASRDINLTAVVPDTCTISSSDNPTAVSHTLSIDAGGKVVTTPVTFSFPILCNSPAVLSLTAVNSGLTGPAAKANFDNKINYRAATSGLFNPVVLDTANPAAPLPDGGNPTAATSAGPVSGTLTLDVTPALNANPLAAGIYNDTLRMTIVPLQ